MNSSSVRHDDPVRAIVSYCYALIVLSIPGFVFFLRVFAYTQFGGPWSTPVVMPSWYIIGYFCVLTGGVFVIPFAFIRSKILCSVVVLAMLLSLVWMMPVILTPRV
jgi:hypothetical protein